MTSRPMPRSPKTRLVLAAGVIAASLSLLTACLGPQQFQGMQLMNADRSANRMAQLPDQFDAQNKAQAWAENLARQNTLYHSNLADGFGNVRWCSIGENVGYGPSISAIEVAYMNSPGHKANILAGKWNGAGVGVAWNGSRVFTVQEFVQTC